MKKILLFLALILLLPIQAHAFLDFSFSAQVPKIDSPLLGASDGTITRLDQWSSTSTPTTAITQRVYGSTIKITGLADGCLSLLGQILTSSGSVCGGGGGGSSSALWSTSTTDTRFIQPAGGLGTIVTLSTTTSATSTNFFATVASSTNIYANNASTSVLTVSNVFFTPFVQNAGNLVLQAQSGSAGFLNMSSGAIASWFNGTFRVDATTASTNSNNGSLVVKGGAGFAGDINVAGNASTTQLTTTGSTYLATTGGNVGIATTTPYAKFTVSMASTTPSLSILAAGSSTPAFYVSSANGNGKVGINTVPLAVLDVQDDITSGSTGIVLRRNSSQYISINEAAGAIHYIQAFGSKPFVFTNQDNTANGISFQFNGIGSTAQNSGFPLLVMLNNGNVGISSSTPAWKLSVAGTTTASSFVATSTTEVSSFQKTTQTNSTSTSFAITSLSTAAGAFLAVNAQGSVIATTTPSSGGGSSPTFASTTGTTLSITTVAGQRVIVWAKGKSNGNGDVNLNYNGVTKDLVGVSTFTPTPYALMYTEIPGAGTHNITIDGSTNGNEQIIVEFIGP